MSTYEWASMIGVIAGGFWVLSQKLSRIEVALAGKVSYADCSEKREKCPCVKEMEELKKKVYV